MMGYPLSSDMRKFVEYCKRTGFMMYVPQSPEERQREEERFAAAKGVSVEEYRRLREEAGREHAEWVKSLPPDDPIFDI